MIRLGGLMDQKAFGKFEMGKVISNPFANAFVNESEGEDHEVSMGQNQLDTIIKMATELKAKMGEDEKEIPAWIQDHISKAENYISQASGNYHEYGDSNESVSEASTKLKHTISKKEWAKIPKYNKHIGMDGVHYIMKYDDKIGTYLQGVKIVDESIKEAAPCWKGYKQVGMKDKGGRQVPNCVPNESVVKEISNKTPKIFVKTAAVEKKIKELMADRKKAVVPYNSETDPAKKEKLKQILIKLTNQIKGYESNLVKLRDMEEEYLQQMHADAELDTTGL
jgi:flagellar biosynthesis chaperone FliJ